MHSDSEMYTMGLVFSTSMQSFPIRTTGHDFLHSCWTRRPSEERDVTKERTEPKRGNTESLRVLVAGLVWLLVLVLGASVVGAREKGLLR